MFSAYTTEELREIAVKAVDGKFTAADLPKDPPGTYNSGAMIEMHANLSLTSASEIDSKVKINVPEGRSIELRRTVEPDAQTVRNVIADLFLNKDTWEFDAGASGKAQTGERVRKLLVEHAPELGFIINGLGKEPDLLAGLPELVRTSVREILEDVRGLNLPGLANAQDVSAETRHDHVEQDQVDLTRIVAVDGDGILPVLCEEDGVSEVLQRLDQEIPDGFLIVHDQQGFGASRQCFRFSHWFSFLRYNYIQYYTRKHEEKQEENRKKRKKNGQLRNPARPTEFLNAEGQALHCGCDVLRDGTGA